MRSSFTKLHQLRALQEDVKSLLALNANISSQLPLEFFKLIQTINIYHCALEEQNKLFTHMQAELEKSRNEYINLYDYAPVSYFTLDMNLTI